MPWRILFNRHAVAACDCCVLPMVCSPVGAQTIGYVNIKPPFGGFRKFRTATRGFAPITAERRFDNHTAYGLDAGTAAIP